MDCAEIKKIMRNIKNSFVQIHFIIRCKEKSPEGCKLSKLTRTKKSE